MPPFIPSPGNRLHFVRTGAGRFLRTLLKQVPTRCVLCQHTALRDNLCSLCWQDVPRLDNVCTRCALPVVHGSLCGPCLLSPPPWTHLRCAVPYADPFNTLIAQYKFGGRVAIAQPLAALMLEQLLQPYVPTAFEALSPNSRPPTPDVLVPMPLHWTRLWSRGFNQTERLSAPLSRELALPVYRALSRQRRTSAQTLTAPTRRKANLARAFEVTLPVRGRHIALIDDVVTTGATAGAATRALLRAGAGSVQIWACARARAPHPGSRP